MNNRTIISIFVLLLIFIGIYFYLNRKEVETHWYKTNEDSKVQPYDYGIFKSLIKKSSQNFQVSENQSFFTQKDTNFNHSTYLFIGTQYNLYDYEIDSLFRKVSRGAQAFIISENMPIVFLNKFKTKTANLSTFEYSTLKVEIKTLYNHSKIDTFTFAFNNGVQDVIENWQAFYAVKPDNFDDFNENAFNLELSTIDSFANCIKIKYGKGEFFLHANPLLFTNYCLKNELGFQYTQEMFNSVNLDHVFYDIDSRKYKINKHKSANQELNPLSFIMSNRSTRMAWQLLIISLILFVAFKIKRQQRVIPVYIKKHNSSLNFVQTMSNLFFNKVKYTEMAKIKMRLFQYFIKFHLKISSQEINDEKIQLIASKTMMEKHKIEEVFNYYKFNIENKSSNINSASLIKFIQDINNIYQSYYNQKSNGK